MPAPTTIPTPEIVTCHRLNERSSTGRSAVEPDVSVVIGRSFRTSAALVFEVLPAECPERHHDEEGRPDRKHYDRVPHTGLFEDLAQRGALPDNAFEYTLIAKRQRVGVVVETVDGEIRNQPPANVISPPMIPSRN